jgi:outer membrane protein TolC
MTNSTGRILLGAALSFCLVAARAQAPKDTLSITLDKAIEIALSDNPTMKVADKEIELKKVANKEAWQSLLPEAGISFSVDHTIKASTLKLGGQSFKMGQDDSNTSNAGLSISLPLFAPAVYRTMSITRKDIELAVEQSRSSRLSLINQVTKAYFQLLLSQDTYDVMTKSYKLAEDNFNVVNAKFTQGTVSEFDKISAEVQMRSTKPSVVSSANAITLAQLQLKVLMGITEDVAIVIADNLSNYETSMFADAINATPLSLDNNSTMKQLDMNRNLLQQSIKLARTNFMPTLAMSFSYQYQSLYNPDFNFFSYDWSNSSSVAFSLSIPLYKASNFTKVKTAKLQLQQLEWNRTDTERNLNTQAQSYRNNMTASTEQVVSNKETVLQAEKAVQIASKRYEVGRGTVLELNSSQVSLTQAQLTYNQSIYDYLTAKADLEQVLGIDKTEK